MAIRVHQREIVEVAYPMPDGSTLVYPALIISRDEIQDYEDGLFYAVLISSKNHYPELTIPIKNEWLQKPLSKNSYFVTHIIAPFTVEQVMNRYNNFIKSAYFDSLIDSIIANVIGC